MAYRFESRARYSEMGVDRKLSLEALVDYFQDCSTFQSEELGRGLDYLKERHRVWMILSWQIEILRRPEQGEKIAVETWPHGFKAFYGYRNFVLKDEQGEYLAKANSVWVYIDTETGKPAKILEENREGYVLEAPLEMQEVSRKIQMPAECVKMESFSVRRHHLDSNYHVNNGQYVSMAEEYLPEGFEVTGLQVEYRQQARLHDVIVPLVQVGPEETIVCLCDEKEKPYSVIVFKGKVKEQNGEHYA